MKYEMNFGSLSASRGSQQVVSSDKFRLALLGDFSGRANSGRLDTGDALANRKPLRVDVDNLDDLVERFEIKLRLPIADNGGNVELTIESMDDFHPDELYEKLEVFTKLSSLRNRLSDDASFGAASKAVLSLLGQQAVDRHADRVTKPRGSAIPNAKMSDFARLVGQPTATEPETPVVDLLKQLVRPHLSGEADPRQDQMIATVDEALSDTMRRVLHHADFQSLESLWRCVELLVRRLETDSDLQIVLYDVTAEELAADLSSTNELHETGLYKLLVEQPSLDAQQGALSVILGSYVFEQTPPHADLLGRMAKIAAAAGAPFIASISNECLKKPDLDDIHPLVKQSWDQLRQLPEADFIGLTVPRFMLRWPYGKKSEPIDSFQFEEFTRRSGVKGMLWGNSCTLAGLLLGATFRKQGMKSMQLGSILSVDDMPYYYYTDDDNDQIALPCTDRLLSERIATWVTSQNFMPLLAIKGRPEVRLGGFRGLSGKPLAGPWGGGSGTSPSRSAAVAAPSSPSGAAVAPAPAPSAPVSGTAEPSEAASSVDNELDALLADLDDSATPASDAPAAAPPAAPEPAAAQEADDDLDALLASLDSDTPSAESGDDDMDPDLAALLADL